MEAEGAGGREVVLSVRERGVKERWILSGEGGEREEGGGEEDVKEEGRRVRCGRPDEDPRDDIVCCCYWLCSCRFLFLLGQGSVIKESFCITLIEGGNLSQG